MRILQLIDSLNTGGAERMCVNISNVLNANGYEVILCATRGGGPLEQSIDPAVRYIILQKKHSLDFSAFTKLLKLVRENSIEIVHAHSSSIFWAVATKLRYSSTKVIWHDHLGIKIHDRRKEFFYKLISKKIDAIIPVNDELADWSRSNMKVSPGKIIKINNFPLLNPVERNPNPEFFTIVCLANLRPQKDHGTLIKAVSLLVKQNLQTKIKVILAGSVDHSVYTNSIRSLISELDLQDTVEILGPVEDNASVLSFADCGVLTSISEGLPVALLEYGLAGLPAVVTDVGQCAEVVDRGTFGILCKQASHKEIAIALKWIIENRKQAIEMGEQFRKHVMKEYGPEKFMYSYHSILNTIYLSDSN